MGHGLTLRRVEIGQQGFDVSGCARIAAVRFDGSGAFGRQIEQRSHGTYRRYRSWRADPIPLLCAQRRTNGACPRSDHRSPSRGGMRVAPSP